MIDGLTTTAIVLLTICLVLTLLPPKWDPAIRWKERQERRRLRPGCYGTFPSRHPHIWAERDCVRCSYQDQCFKESPHV
jgi:hypothetical protein